MGSGPNKQVKIELKIQITNGNSSKNTPIIPLTFKTKDSEGKHVYTNRGRAMQSLIDFLIDNHVIYPGEIILKALNQQRKMNGQKEIIAKEIQITDKVTYIQ